MMQTYVQICTCPKQCRTCVLSTLDKCVDNHVGNIKYNNNYYFLENKNYSYNAINNTILINENSCNTPNDILFPVIKEYDNGNIEIDSKNVIIITNNKKIINRKTKYKCDRMIIHPGEFKKICYKSINK